LPEDLAQALHGLESARDAFAAVSKTFTTQEDDGELRRRARLAGSGHQQRGCEQALIAGRAKTGCREKGRHCRRQYLAFWDWVGGRFSVWSNCSLSVEIALGSEAFDASCKAAADMDAHVLSAAPEQNVGFLAALVDFGTPRFWITPSRAITPYATRLHLRRLTSAIGDGERRQVRAGGWGWRVGADIGPRSSAARARPRSISFFQWLHQGTSVCPVDFIVAKEDRLGKARRAACAERQRAGAVRRALVERPQHR